MLDKISVVIITKNAADTLRETLDSVTQFAEVVVYDNGSEDATLTIACEFENVSLYQGEFMGFGPTKAYAVELASNDWILSLDADEKVSHELSDYLQHWHPDRDYIAGIVRRDNYFMGELVDKGGWGRDWLLRLFNRQYFNFNNSAVHELVEPTSELIEKHIIKCPIEHNAVQQISQFLVKIDRYTEIRRQTSDKTYHPTIIFIKCLFAFFKSYILKAGVLAGWRGFVIAWNESNGVFYKYMKIYADKHS